MRLLHESEFYRVEEPEPNIIKILRKNSPFHTPADVEAACGPVQAALDAAGRGLHALLIDTREAVGRNDETSEAMFAHHRDRMVMGFRAVALVAKTPAGRLQTQRLLTQAKSTARVFGNPVEALLYLRSALAPRK